MKIGAVYPQIELRGDPEAVRRIGISVESLGFDYLLAYDHVLGATHEGREPKLTGPYTEKDPFHDPLVMFAHLAALTRRIELVTGILILPQRQTAVSLRGRWPMSTSSPAGASASASASAGTTSIPGPWAKLQHPRQASRGPGAASARTLERASGDVPGPVRSHPPRLHQSPPNSPHPDLVRRLLGARLSAGCPTWRRLYFFRFQERVRMGGSRWRNTCAREAGSRRSSVRRWWSDALTRPLRRSPLASKSVP